MRDFFKYTLTYKVGITEIEFDEYMIVEQGKYSDMQAHDIAFQRALLMLKGNEYVDFDFQKSNELEHRRWEQKRIKEQGFKTSLARSVELAQRFNHEGS